MATIEVRDLDTYIYMAAFDVVNLDVMSAKQQAIRQFGATTQSGLEYIRSFVGYYGIPKEIIPLIDEKSRLLACQTLTASEERKIHKALINKETVEAIRESGLAAPLDQHLLLVGFINYLGDIYPALPFRGSNRLKPPKI